jgi:uncharacterized protein YegL
MSGTPWNELVRAYAAFINKRNGDQIDGDMVSVVQFGSASRVTVQKSTIAACPRTLHFASGGTAYKPAIADCRSVILSGLTSNPRHKPIMIFMSDGANGDGDCAAEIKELKSKIQQTGQEFTIKTVAFGTGHIARLQEIAIAGGGEYVQAVDGTSLGRTFVQFADIGGKQAIGGAVVQRISEKLVSQILLDRL